VGVRLRPYLLATAVALPAGTAVQVGVGASAALFVSGRAAFTALPLAVGLALLGWLAVRAWRRPEPVVDSHARG
jgi:threonine/homoserine/homoserine lactone efflux protein